MTARFGRGSALPQLIGKAPADAGSKLHLDMLINEAYDNALGTGLRALHLRNQLNL